MHIYFLLIRLAALMGNKKAQLLLEGQANTLRLLRQAPADMWKDCIWFHTASVGEFEQARPIIEAIGDRQKNDELNRLRLNDEMMNLGESQRPKMILTFFSPSGYEMRKNYDKVDGVFYLPFATRRNAKEFLNLVQPKMAVFVKYEFWPAYLKQLHERQIPTYIISAIFRKNQLFFKPWGKAYRKLLTYFTTLFVQDEESKHLLNQFGIENVEVTGDTRFDRVSAIAKQAKEISLVDRFANNPQSTIHHPLLIAGSTWPEDEELLARYIKERPEVKLVLVPHEIDEAHLHRIFELFKGKYVRYTEANRMNIEHTRMLVVDTMGLLSSIYRYADVAYIGGGFGAGIHNTIEAAVYGIPVLFGPKHDHFREAKGLIAAGAGFSIHNYDELRDQLDEAFANQTTMGAKAKAYVESECGASIAILNSLKFLAPKGHDYLKV